MDLGKVGVVFNGGGFSGAFSVGFARAIWELGIKPEHIQGVSVGTLNAAKIIESGVKGLEHVWLDIEKDGASSIFNWMDIAPNVLKRSNALFYQKGLLRIVNGIDIAKIVQSPINLQIVTCNEFKDEQEEIFHNHDPRFQENPELFRKTILASTAIPGILPPIEINGEEHSDGVFFQLEPLISAGCDTIFLLLNDQAAERKARWDKRLAQERHKLYEKVVIAELKEILIKHKDYQVYAPDDLDLEQKNLPSLVRKMITAEKSIRSTLISAAKGDDINFVPHRIIILYTEAPISALYTTGFARGDIKTAINVGYVQAKNILTKALK